MRLIHLMSILQQLVCPFENACNIDIESRRRCQHCRMKKCIDMGMKKELIQKGKRPVSDCDADMSSVNGEPSSPRPEFSSAPSSQSSVSPKPLSKKIKIKTESPSITSRTTTTVVPAETLQVMLGNTSGLVLSVSSPSPSAESFSSANSNGDAALLDGCDLEVLCSFEKEKVVELIRANEVYCLTKFRPREGTLGVGFQLVFFVGND